MNKPVVDLEKRKLRRRKINLLTISRFFRHYFLKLIHTDPFFSIEIKKTLRGNKKANHIFLRIENTFFFLKTRMNKQIFEKTFIYPNGFNCNIEQNDEFFSINFSVEENVDQLRIKLFERLFLMTGKSKKNYFPKKLLQIMIVTPNQSSLLQLVHLLSFMKEKKRNNLSFFRGNCWKEELYNLKFGKILKPADFKKNLSDGHEDFFRIGCSFQNKNILFGNQPDTDFLFVTPLFLRTLNRAPTIGQSNFRHVCFIDNLHSILMQNPENFNMILTKLSFRKKQSVKLCFKDKKMTNMMIRIFSTSNSFIKDREIITNCFFGSNFSTKGQIEKIKKPMNLIFVLDQDKQISEMTVRLSIFKEYFQHIIYKKANKGVLIFCRDYLEYIFIRNHLWKTTKKKNVFLIMFHEYLDQTCITKQKIFTKKKVPKIIIMTERFYFFYRYHLFDIGHLFFYSIPLNFEFFFEICKFQKSNEIGESVYSITNLADSYFFVR